MGNPEHAGVTNLVRDLNHLYRNEPALWELDTDPDGFAWISASDADYNIIAFLRKGIEDNRPLVCVCNLSPIARYRYRVGMPYPGRWNEILNTDATYYGGGNVGNDGAIDTTPEPANGLAHSALMTLPPLGTVWFTQASSPENHRG